MKSFFSLRNVIPSLVISLLLIPAAQAGPIGDAFNSTVEQSAFSYDAQAGLTIDKGGEFGIPFALEMSVREEGGKNRGVYGKSGSLWGELSNIDDLPRELFGLNKVNMMFKYNGAHIESSKTSFGEVESLAFSSDHEKMNEIMNMLNQLTKFYTGKSFKISQADLADKIGSLIGDSFYGPSEEEMILSALTGSNQSIAQVIGTFGEFVDAMVESGFMNLQVQEGSQRRNRSIGAGSTYVLTLGDSVDARGGEIFRDAFANLLSKMFPGLGTMLAEEISRESGETIARDLSEFLAEASAVKMELSINIASGLIQSTDFMMDLSALGVPFKLDEQVTFSYTSGYSAKIPTDENYIIDINQIIDGFIAIGEMGSSAFENSNAFEFETQGSFVETTEVDYDSYVYNDIQYVKSICGEDRSCRISEMRQIMQSLRELKREGYLSGRDYGRAVRDLKKGLR